MNRQELENDFVKIVQQHSRIIYKVASFYVDVNQPIEDLYQETILNLWKSFPNFRSECSHSTWIYKVALNTCISFFRRRKTTSIPMATIPEIADSANEEKELIDELYKAINKLGKLERALVLLYLDDKSYKEISEITGLTVTNVATKLNRTKKKLTQLSNN